MTTELSEGQVWGWPLAPVKSVFALMFTEGLWLLLLKGGSEDNFVTILLHPSVHCLLPMLGSGLAAPHGATRTLLKRCLPARPSVKQLN